MVDVIVVVVVISTDELGVPLEGMGVAELRGELVARGTKAGLTKLCADFTGVLAVLEV